jgi:hypothetical protein
MAEQSKHPYVCCWHDTGARFEDGARLEICCYCRETRIIEKDDDTPVEHGPYAPKPKKLSSKGWEPKGWPWDGDLPSPNPFPNPYTPTGKKWVLEREPSEAPIIYWPDWTYRPERYIYPPYDNVFTCKTTAGTSDFEIARKHFASQGDGGC